MLSLIDQVLDLSRIEAGKLALAPETFDLWESLAGAMQQFTLRARERGLQLAWHIPADVPRLVVGDSNRLRQVVMNLVGNAIKFTERGEVVLEVTLQSQAGQALILHFVVRDTGIGIPQDKQATIFGMFEQADSSLSRRHGGAGLGLCIASQLVGLMGGRMWVESDVGRGSRFHFTVRLGSAAASGTSESEVPVAAPRQSGRPGKLRILLAEDSLVIQRVVMALLAEDGHVVTTVNSGAALLAALASETFDLVLMDIDMLETDAWTATAAIRAQERQSGRHTAIIALVADAPEGDREQCFKAGVDRYLVQPIRRKELLEAMEAVVAPGS